MDPLQFTLFLFILTSFEGIHKVHPQTCTPSSNQCSAQATNYALLQVNQTTDHIYIGGIFSLHSPGTNLYSCGSIREGGIQNLEAFMWAVSTYKQRYQNRFQGINIGALAFDSCLSPQKAMQQILNFENCEISFGTPAVPPNSVYGYVGPDSDKQAGVLAPELSNIQKPIISPVSTSISLSSNDFLYRTVPSDMEEIKALIKLFQEESIEFVQVVYSSDAYGISMWNQFQTLTANENICTINSKQLPDGYNNMDVDTIISSLTDFNDTKVVVLFANAGKIMDILKRATRNSFTWVGTSSWGTSTSVVAGMEGMAVGSVTLSLDGSSTSYLQEFENYYSNAVNTSSSTWNPWFNEYLLSRAANAAVQLDDYVPYTLQAVDAILTGMNEAIKSRCQNIPGLCGSFYQPPSETLIKDKILQVEFPNTLKFDTNGDQIRGRYSVNRFLRSDVNGVTTYNYVPIGSYYQNQLTLQQNLEVTSVCGISPCTQCMQTAATTQSPTPAAMSAPTKLREGNWVIALIILAAIGIILVIAFEIYLSCKMSGKFFIKSMWLGQMLLCALFLSFLCLFAFVPAPTTATCGIIRFGVGICYAMIFSVFLVKLMIIFSSKSVGYLKGIFQLLMFIFATGVQVGIDVEWLIMRPPKAIRVISNSSGLIEPWTCSQSFTSHVTTLSYVMFLIVICALLSLKAHGIVTNHREVVYIGIGSFLSVLIFLAWILLGILNTNKEFEDPCLAFGLFIVAFIVLLTMYVPKVRQLNSMDKGNMYLDNHDEDDHHKGTQYINHSIIPPGFQASTLFMGNGSTLDKVIHEKPAAPSPPVIYVDDVDAGIYNAPDEPQMQQLHIDANQDALYLRHPGSLNHIPAGTNSLRLAGPYGVRHSGSHSVHSAGHHSIRSIPIDSTRVLKRTADLSGRTPMVIERKTRSEVDGPVSRGYTVSEMGATIGVPHGYGTVRSVISSRSARTNGTLGRNRGALYDVGSL